MALEIRVYLFYVLLSKKIQATKHLKEEWVSIGNKVGLVGMFQPKCKL